MLFQFHKGTIRTCEWRTPSHRLPNFNSIKVQLKRVAKATAKNYALFQFHKGTIKTKDEVKKRITECSFQFHKGTIKTSCKKEAKRKY